MFHGDVTTWEDIADITHSDAMHSTQYVQLRARFSAHRGVRAMQLRLRGWIEAELLLKFK